MAGVFGSGSHARSKEKPPELSPGGFVSDVVIARYCPALTQAAWANSFQSLADSSISLPPSASNSVARS